MQEDAGARRTHAFGLGPFVFVLLAAKAFVVIAFLFEQLLEVRFAVENT